MKKTQRTDVQGPLRRAPDYYVGETVTGRPVVHPDVERNANGTVPGIRDKGARRLIRKALRSRTSFENGLRLSRAMQAQAREVADDADRSNAWARRLYDKELAIHQPVHNLMTRAERRKMKREMERRGEKDAISQLVDRMAGEKK